jgi:UDP-N-acetylglucosamine 2-epimerase (non-hydrolysing)
MECISTQILSGLPTVRLVEPLDYFEFTATMAASDLIVTDSGGVQEEAPSLGKPVLVVRENTERPEAVQAGVARLIGVSGEAVHRHVCELLDDERAYASMARAVNPFGDGHAAARIADILATSLAQPHPHTNAA